MHLIWTIVIGFVVWLLARFVMPGDDKMGFFLTAALGIAGSLIVTYAGHMLGWYQAGQGAGFLASLVGAVVLLILHSGSRQDRFGADRPCTRTGDRSHPRSS